MRKRELDLILAEMVESHENVSDLLFTVGKRPQVESAGILREVKFDNALLNKPLTPFQTELIALNLINADRRLTDNLVTHGYCDLSYLLPGRARFRVNIFQQRGCYSIVLRKLSTRVPSINDLKIPAVLAEIAEEKNGLVLVTGATGSGKSSTLAALLDIVNEQRAVHVITLEDPVEFIHSHKSATFNQRELGTDFDTYAGGLRAALRQAPKLILVGEMRDRETVEIAMTAAETGHLVVSTIHTIDAGQSINRIVGFFEKEEERQVRIRLADTIRWIVSQRLLPKIGGGRFAAVEIMRTNLRVKEATLLGESEGKTFYDIIEAGEAFGMQTFDKALTKAYETGYISEEIALAYATRKAVVGRGIDMIKSAKGEKTSDIHGLKIDGDYERKLKAMQRQKL
ncbi:MAG TPA: PilT/PilU family type 4a pilus ATPase [Dissulfurispiraceae bacterium]|nr:PilT/PilU family type 4a pilus ATPase [Dissulfurispiraceae bacterium]